MKIVVEVDGFVYSKDFGYEYCERGEEPEEFLPDITEALYCACFLVGKVYSDEKVKDALPKVAEDY